MSDQIPTSCPTYCTGTHPALRPQGDGVFHESTANVIPGLSVHSAAAVAELVLCTEAWEDGEGLLHGPYVRLTFDDGASVASLMISDPEQLVRLAMHAVNLAADLADRQAHHIEQTGRDLVCFPA